MKRPETGFTVELTEGTLHVPGQDRPRHAQPYVELRISGIHSRDIEMALHTARDITQIAIDHGSRHGLDDYSPETQEAAYSWANRSDQLPGEH